MTSYYGSYSSIKNSPILNGLLQFDLWNEKPLEFADNIQFLVDF